MASPTAHNLGRAHVWRDRRPDVRASCDAANCGARPYFQDPLGAVILSPALVTAPPVELWPSLVIHATLPSDVAAWLEGGPTLAHISVGARMEGASHTHPRKALARGIEPAAIEQVALPACPTIGFPNTMTALGWIQDVLKKS